MAEQARSIIALEHVREASQRFEYFILGVSVGLCTYIGHTLSPQRLGLNPYTLEVLSLVLLIASIVVGFKRIESVIMSHRHNQAILHFTEERSELATNYKGEPMLFSPGHLLSPEQVLARVANLDSEIAKARRLFSERSAILLKQYRIRNWLLAIGFVGLFASKVISPYFPQS